MINFLTNVANMAYEIGLILFIIIILILDVFFEIFIVIMFLFRSIIKFIFFIFYTVVFVTELYSSNKCFEYYVVTDLVVPEMFSKVVVEVEVDCPA